MCVLQLCEGHTLGEKHVLHSAGASISGTGASLPYALLGGFSTPEPPGKCLLSLSDGTLLVYRKTTDSCVLIFVPGSVTEFMYSDSFLVV